MLARQGPHQVAQNSTTYVCAGSSLSNFSPLTHFDTVSGGAGSPIVSVSAVAPERPAQSKPIPAARLKRSVLISDLPTQVPWRCPPIRDPGCGRPTAVPRERLTPGDTPDPGASVEFPAAG